MFKTIANFVAATFFFAMGISLIFWEAPAVAFLSSFVMFAIFGVAALAMFWEAANKAAQKRL